MSAAYWQWEQVSERFATGRYAADGAGEEDVEARAEVYERQPGDPTLNAHARAWAGGCIAHSYVPRGQGRVMAEMLGNALVFALHCDRQARATELEAEAVAIVKELRAGGMSVLQIAAELDRRLAPDAKERSDE